MKLADVLRLTKNNYALDLFTPATLTYVQSLLFWKNDRPHLKCQVRGKDVQAKPEEIVRQLWIHRLTAYEKYPLARLAVEVPITFGRDTSKRADLVVFDDDRPTVP